MERAGARRARATAGCSEAMRAALIIVLLSGCAAFEAAYWCANAPQPGPGFCHVSKP